MSIFTFHRQKSLVNRVENVNQQLSPDIFLEVYDHQYVIVWLNRAEKRNALSFTVMDKLIFLAKTLKKWTDIRTVILAGQGKSFCTGIDLADLNNRKNIKWVAWELLKPTQSKFQQVCLIWQSLPVPVISVLHGHCLGAGLQLALASDIRFATADCQFAIMEAKWGLLPDMGLSQSSLGILRADVVKELAMTARVFDGNQALNYGLVSQITNEPMTMAKNLVSELAERSPDAVLASKRLVNKMYQQSASTLYQEKWWQMKLLLSKNRHIAIKKVKDSTVKFFDRQYQ